jgi:hypothetical protein
MDILSFEMKLVLSGRRKGYCVPVLSGEVGAKLAKLEVH